MDNIYTLDTAQKDEYPILLNIWEASVRQSHHFLKEGHIDVLKSIIQENDLFSQVEITCLRDTSDAILGFIGVAGENLEMLFVSADAMGKGVGSRLLTHAIEKWHITTVDVNEQNERAVRFYEGFGFKTVSRSALDGQGNPYPILHMRLQV